MKLFRAGISLSAFWLLLKSVSWAEPTLWATCGDERIAVEGESLKQGDTEVYYAGYNYLVFLDAPTRKAKFCKKVGYSWGLIGFRSFPDGKGSSTKEQVFEIRRDWEYKYFLVQSGEEVFLAEDEDKKLYIAREQPSTPGLSVKISQPWAGDNSHLEQPEYRRIILEKDWKDLWQRHDHPGILIPSVNFSSHMVIVIIPGKTLNSHGVELIDMREDAKEIHVDFYQKIYQPKTGDFESNPYGFFVIPRSVKKILIRQNFQFLEDDVSRWRVMAEIEPLY